MKTSSIFYFVLMLLFTACGTSYKPPQQYHFQKTKVYKKDFNTIWNGIIQFVSSFNVPIKTIDKTSGILASDFNLSVDQRDFCDCGIPGEQLGYKHVIEDIRGNFNIVVQEIDKHSTKVTVNTFYKAKYNLYQMDTRTYRYYFTGTLSVLDCNSTGLLEKALLEYIGGL